MQTWFRIPETQWSEGVEGGQGELYSEMGTVVADGEVPFTKVKKKRK